MRGWPLGWAWLDRRRMPLADAGGVWVQWYLDRALEPGVAPGAVSVSLPCDNAAARCALPYGVGRFRRPGNEGVAEGPTTSCRGGLVAQLVRAHA